MYFNKARKIFYTFITKSFVINRNRVDKLKTRSLVISTLFFNFTSVLISQKSC